VLLHRPTSTRQNCAISQGLEIGFGLLRSSSHKAAMACAQTHHRGKRRSPSILHKIHVQRGVSRCVRMMSYLMQLNMSHILLNTRLELQCRCSSCKGLIVGRKTGCSSRSDVSGGCERKRAKETSGEHSCLQLSKSWKVLLATGSQISCRLRIPANVLANQDSDD